MSTILNTEYIQLPVGTSAQRPGSPTVGMMRYNTDIALAEVYTTSGWQAVATPPTITNITGNILHATNSTITINGSNFVSGAIVQIQGAGVNNVNRNLTTTFINTRQLTAATNAASVNYITSASFNVVVINPSGLQTILVNAGTIG
jgi:hypothetical protein